MSELVAATFLIGSVLSFIAALGVLPLLDDPKGVRFDPVMNVLRALCIGVVNGLLWALVIIFGRYALRFGLMLLF